MNKKLKSISVLLLTFIFVISLAAMAFAQPTDVKGHWAEKQISDWVGKGLIKGYQDGTFKPDHIISRAEFATLVNRAFGFTAETPAGFSDVSAGDWFSPEVARTVAAGYMNGYQDGTFKPEQEISRQEVAVILARVLKLEPANNSDAAGKFKDAAGMPEWSKGSIGAVVAGGLMNGYPDNTFQPEQSITRAEAVVTLDRCPVAAEVKTVTYDKAGAFGPVTGTETVDGNVIVSVARVTLQNLIITGDLLLAEGIGDGDVTLKNVTVQGSTTVKGGGAHSVILENCTLPSITVSKEGVRVVASGNTSVSVVRLESGATLVELQATGPGFETVNISQEIPAGVEISLSGNFTTVSLAGTVSLTVASGTVADLNVSGPAAGTIISLAQEARINTMTLDAAVTVAGTGAIGKAFVNVSGSTIGPNPTSTEKAPGVTVTVGATTTTITTNTGPGSGTGTGGGGGVAPLYLTGADLGTGLISNSGNATNWTFPASVPADATFRLHFTNGVIRDHWDNNQNCFSLRANSGASVPINVFRASNWQENYENEKENIYISHGSLTPGQTYTIVISASLQSNNDRYLGTENTITFTVAGGGGGGGGSDTTPPVFAGTYPKASNIAATQLNLLVKSNEGGQAYFVVLANDAVAPTPDQVVNGQDSTGAPLAANLKGNINLTANTEASAAISALTPATDYDVYVVAKDASNNLQAAVSKVDVTTLDSSDHSAASAALAIAGNKTAGAGFDLSVTGAKSTSGADLEGSIAVTANSDVDGQVYSGDTAFANGAATIIIPAGTVITAGSQTLTVVITGVTPHPTVAVSVYAAAASTMQLTQDITAPAKNGQNFGQQPIITLKDAYGNTCANDSTTVVTASKKDGGTWTFAGTMAVTASNGVATFTDLSSLEATQILNAQLAFDSPGLAQITSAAVTLPAPSEISPANSTVEVNPALGEGVTSTFIITLRDQYGYLIANTTKSLKIAVTITNGDLTTTESYVVKGSSLSATQTLSWNNAPLDANGQATFNVVMPAAIDSGDAISIQLTQNNGTAIGSFGYTKQ